MHRATSPQRPKRTYRYKDVAQTKRKLDWPLLRDGEAIRQPFEPGFLWRKGNALCPEGAALHGFLRMIAMHDC